MAGMETVLGGEEVVGEVSGVSETEVGGEKQIESGGSQLIYS